MPLRSLAVGRIALRFVRFLLALALALLLGEVTVRALGLGVPPRGVNNTLPLVAKVPGQEALGMTLRPGAAGEVVYPGFGDEPDRVIAYAVNAQGFRDAEVPEAKPPWTFRIAILGDSMTYGTGVQLEDTYPKQLERLLAEVPGLPRVEVMNCGVYAHNTIQQVAWLEFNVVRFRPDLVLLVSTAVDASGHGITPPEKIGRPWEERWLRRLGLTSGVWDEGTERDGRQAFTMALRRRSRLVDLVAHQAYATLLSRVHQQSYRRDWAEGSDGRRAVRDSLERAARLARREGFAFHVGFYPTLTSLDGDYPFAPQIAIVEAICDELQVPFHSLLPPLEGLDAERLHAHAHDRHPNPTCNGIVARYLVERLLPHVPTAVVGG